LITSWQRFWFAPAPPHIYAVLRIAFGGLGLVHLVAMSDIAAYWAPDGILPFASHHELSARLLAGGYGLGFGAMLWIADVACFAAMTLGFATNIAVPGSFVASLLEVRWNRLPLSAAFQLYINVLFCLLWANCGRVWSIDAMRARAQRAPDNESMLPLRLIRFQLALLYLTSALWKLRDPIWRDGSALHYILSSPVYTRFPGGPPPELERVLPAITYAVLGWELAFAFLLLNRRTRIFVLVSGIIMHIGMWVFLEIGPFTPVVLVCYLAFLDPVWVASLVRATGASSPQPAEHL
jgi:hypothetical protein